MHPCAVGVDDIRLHSAEIAAVGLDGIGVGDEPERRGGKRAFDAVSGHDNAADKAFGPHGSGRVGDILESKRRMRQGPAGVGRLGCDEHAILVELHLVAVAVDLAVERRIGTVIACDVDHGMHRPVVIVGRGLALVEVRSEFTDAHHVEHTGALHARGLSVGVIVVAAPPETSSLPCSLPALLGHDRVALGMPDERPFRARGPDRRVLVGVAGMFGV